MSHNQTENNVDLDNVLTNTDNNLQTIPHLDSTNIQTENFELDINENLTSDNFNNEIRNDSTKTDDILDHCLESMSNFREFLGLTDTNIQNSENQNICTLEVGTISTNFTTHTNTENSDCLGLENIHLQKITESDNSNVFFKPDLVTSDMDTPVMKNTVFELSYSSDSDDDSSFSPILFSHYDNIS